MSWLKKKTVPQREALLEATENSASYQATAKEAASKGKSKVVKSTNDDQGEEECWLDAIPQVAVKHHYQAFLLVLVKLSDTFRHLRYARLFLLVAEPVEAMLDLLRSKRAAQDVMIATLSGSIRTVINQILSEPPHHTGLECQCPCRKATVGQDAATFAQYGAEAIGALTKLVGSLQEAIRVYETGSVISSNGKSSPGSPPPRPGNTPSNKNLSHQMNWHELAIQVSRLRRSPDPATKGEVLIRSLGHHKKFSLLGLFLFSIACGSILCSTWYSENMSERFWMYIVPGAEALLGMLLMMVGCCRANIDLKEMRKAYNEVRRLYNRDSHRETSRTREISLWVEK